MMSVAILRAFAWAGLTLPMVAAAIYFFGAPILALLNLSGATELPLTLEGLILSGFLGLLLWALLSGLALLIEASVMSARHAWAMRGLLEELREALEVARPSAGADLDEASAEAEAAPPEKPKTPLTFDNW